MSWVQIAATIVCALAVVGMFAALWWVMGRLRRLALAAIAKRIYGGVPPRACYGCDECGAAVERSPGEAGVWVAERDGLVIATALSSAEMVAALRGMGRAAHGAVARWTTEAPRSRHAWWCPDMARLMNHRDAIERGVRCTSPSRRKTTTNPKGIDHE